ncbi:hypothetical protein M514_00888 [Trichuris suis]|uniref:Uncharacterized protein n=1 Tax=Trichuris suis TaxID=68888 RepID=A0A085MYW4_9BILA|nr:hypothetical protein M513_00888 [Trichuris suis]KFD62410.1 hypothetical protein M514_00888 [Trichuris suis]
MSKLLFFQRNWDILSIVINPFRNVEDEEIFVQEELLELQSKAELKARLAELWLQKQVPVLYPACGYGHRNEEAQARLQLVRRDDLRLRVTSMEPDIGNLVRSQLCQPSTSA